MFRIAGDPAVGLLKRRRSNAVVFRTLMENSNSERTRAGARSGLFGNRVATIAYFGFVTFFALAIYARQVSK